MDENTLVKFIERIIHNCAGDKQKTSNSLNQLRRIILEQHPSSGVTNMIDKAVRDVPELTELINRTTINARDLEEADRRATLRRKREEELNNRGRC